MVSVASNLIRMIALLKYPSTLQVRPVMGCAVGLLGQRTNCAVLPVWLLSFFRLVPSQGLVTLSQIFSRRSRCGSFSPVGVKDEQ